MVGFPEPGQGCLAADEDRPGVDGLHQVVAFYGQVRHALQAYGAGVVDQAVDAAEVVGGLFHDLGYLVFILDVQFQCQCLAARVFHFLSDGVDGAGKLGVRFIGFGCDDDVGALARAGEGDGAADAAAAAGDEDGFSVKRAGHCDCSPGLDESSLETIIRAYRLRT